MKKVIKIIGYSLLTLTILGIGISVYIYQTNETIRAMIQNDEAKLMYHPSKQLNSLDAYNFEEFKVNVNDSIDVYSYYLKSPIKPKGNIFFIHGGGGNATVWVTLFEPLINEGYNVYAADWRGAGKSNGSPNYKALLEDIEASYKHFKKETKNDSLKTIIYGMSLGGQLAVKITEDNQDTVDALVLDGSLASAQQIAMDYAPMNFMKKRAEKHPEKFNQLYVASRDIKNINDIPKLIIHSTKDQNIPYHHVNAIFENAKEPKTLWTTKTAHVMTLKELSNESVSKINMLLK